MTQPHPCIYASADAGLVAHWQRGLGHQAVVVSEFAKIKPFLSPASVLWMDLAMPDMPGWSDPLWLQMVSSPNLKIVACSSAPGDDESISALDAGCVAYCHAFSDLPTLSQIKQVVDAGHVWIGTRLMKRLIQSASQVKRSSVERESEWAEHLTAREQEIAILAANGASNQLIASNCAISERTVKAHLSAVFVKLNISDRLQLALRVHGIH